MVTGDPVFEARLWVLSKRIWIAVAVAAFAFAIKSLVRKP
jgi:hypothetical protein